MDSQIIFVFDISIICSYNISEHLFGKEHIMTDNEMELIRLIRSDINALSIAVEIITSLKEQCESSQAQESACPQVKT